MEAYTVIVSAYNESQNIGALMKRIPQSVKPHVIVVDDGSKDNTADIARSFNVRVIVHQKNKGKGGAIRTGLDAAKTDVVILMDGDNQHNPAEIPMLLAKLAEGNEMVIGSRFLANNKMPFYRNLANTVLSVISRLAGVGVSDPISGYRAMRKSKFKGLTENGFNLELEFLYNARRDRLRVGEVSINVPFIVKHGSVLNHLPNAIKVYGSMVLYSLKRALLG
jgi:glycosyltransferase involved in cell wall biosynthesis